VASGRVVGGQLFPAKTAVSSKMTPLDFMHSRPIRAKSAVAIRTADASILTTPHPAAGKISMEARRKPQTPRRAEALPGMTD